MSSKPLIVSAVALLGLGLCSSAPPPEGVETRFMVGSGGFEYQSGGCGGPTYVNKAIEGSAYAAASYRHSTGLTGTAEVSGAVAHTRSSTLLDEGDEPGPNVPLEDEDELGRKQTWLSLVSRIGYHHSYFGLEAGVLFGGDVLESDPIIFPSSRAWVGVPRYVYAWGSLLHGPVSIGHIPVEAGLGHAGGRLRAAAGITWEPGLMLEGSYQISPALPLFVGGRFTQLFAENQGGTLIGLTTAYTW